MTLAVPFVFVTFGDAIWHPYRMHENLILAGAPPWTPLGCLTVLPDSLAGKESAVMKKPIRAVRFLGITQLTLTTQLNFYNPYPKSRLGPCRIVKNT